MHKVFVVAALAVSFAGCDSALGTIATFEVRYWDPDFRGDFSNGDFVALGERVSSSRVVRVDDDWPGLNCEHLRPAPDDTDFLRCARLYAKPANGTTWVEVPEPPGTTTFLGQDVDGARYFVEPGGLWVLPKDATEFLPKVTVDASFGAPFLHPFGFLTFVADGRSPSSPQAIEKERLFTGTLRLYRRGAFSEPFQARHLDAEGNVYLLTEAGLDRVSPDGAKRDASWFKWPGTNQIYDLLGVGRDGRLYALSTERTNFTGADTRKDNDVPVEALMALSPGASSWVQVSEPFSTPESRAIGYGLEKPYGAFQGRDDSWWLSKCVANCDPNGANSAHQSVVWQWRKPGTAKSAPLDLTYTAWRGTSVEVQLPKHGDLKLWSLGSAPAEAGLTQVVSGTSSLTLGVSHTARAGRYAVTLTNPGGPSQTLQLEVKALDLFTVEAPRRITLTKFSVVSSGDRTVWLDGNGVVHFLDLSNTPGVVTGLPPVQSVEGEYVHAVDGRVFVLSANANTPNTIEVTPLTLPPIHSMHHGAGLTIDRRAVLLRDNAVPFEGVTDVVSLSVRQTSDVTQGGRLTWAVRTLDARGKETDIAYTTTYVMPLVTPVTEVRAISRLGVGGTAIGTDGRLVDDLTTFGTSPVKTFDSIIRFSGSLGADTFEDAFPLVVTQRGEAWVGLRALTLPAGRKAEVMIAGGKGQYVWLDDGTVLDVPDPISMRGDTISVVDLPGLAVPRP